MNVDDRGLIAGMPVTDDGRRLSDAVRLAQLAGGVGRWIAARLSDGGTDGVIYDSKADAIRHQLHETQCAYVLVPHVPMPPAEATAYLAMHRRMYAAGMRIRDPQAPTPIAPLRPSYAPNRADRRRARRMHR